MRLLFTDFSVGDGKLWVHGPDGTVDGPYTGRGVFEDGQFWSATVGAEAATIEFVPEDGGEWLPFHVTKVSHQARPREGAAPTGETPLVGPLATESKDPAAGCNQDANCYPEWQNAMKSVAFITFETEQGPAMCSGAAVATRNNSGKPYFLTAAHCVESETVARSVEAYWAYHSTGCRAGKPADRGTLKSASGGNLLVTGGMGGGDYSLLRLLDIPAGVVLSGWDPGEPQVGSYMVGIHHPVGSYKRISFGTRIGDFGVQIGPDPLPASNFYQVLWQRGIAEPGSSGSPLFTSPGILVGVLSYGPVATDLCAIPVQNGSGRFSVAYPAMRDWLEDLPFTEVAAAPRSLEFRGTNGVLAAPLVQTITVATQSRGAVDFNVRADTPWIKLSAVKGSTSSATPGTVDISIDPKLLQVAGAYTGIVSITSGAAPPQFVTVRVDMRVNRSNVVASVSPNPVVEREPDSDGARWLFRLRLEETAGVATRLATLKINAVDYSARIVEWFGADRIPASGSLQARLRMANLNVPTEQYFEVGGLDEATGQRWYQTIVVVFQ